MKKRHFTEKEKKLIGWAAIVIFVVFTAAVCWFVGRPMGNFVSEPEKFRLWVESHGLWSQAAYVGMVFLQVLVAVIPGDAFGPGGESYVRACYAASMKDIAEAVSRLDNFLQNLKGKEN
mgnify:CR=1 FL=1